MINGTEDNERFFNHYKIRKKRKMLMRGTRTKRKQKSQKLQLPETIQENCYDLKRFPWIDNFSF